MMVLNEYPLPVDLGQLVSSLERTSVKEWYREWINFGEPWWNVYTLPTGESIKLAGESGTRTSFIRISLEFRSAPYSLVLTSRDSQRAQYCTSPRLKISDDLLQMRLKNGYENLSQGDEIRSLGQRYYGLTRRLEEEAEEMNRSSEEKAKKSLFQNLQLFAQ